jgi:hypothetical protein
MVDHEGILEGARSIRPLLSELVQQEATHLDSRLADCLSTEDKVDSANKAIDLLHERETTRKWIKEFLEIRKTASIEVTVGYAPLPGRKKIIAVAKFVCPQGDYVWYQPSVGVAPPRCPTHPGLELVPSA